jgi:hypothetical protein
MRTNKAVAKRPNQSAPKSQVWVKGLEDGEPVFGEKVLNIFQPDMLIPSQFLEAHKRNSYLAPERFLMLAVLRDAIACYQDPLHATNKRKNSLHAEAAKWFFADDPSYPFSFINICDVLGLDANYLRSGLRRWGAVGSKPNGDYANDPERLAS